ncbi:MAG TPA: hypothetical protein VLM19_01290 [Nitrospiraceae bacterium]|nr:hypothetical protein [Nitrospiraceae bacterium]
MDIMAIVAICFPLGMVGMVLAITWIMSDAGLPRKGFDQHTSKRPRLIERKAA